MIKFKTKIAFTVLISSIAYLLGATSPASAQSAIVSHTITKAGTPVIVKTVKNKKIAQGAKATIKPEIIVSKKKTKVISKKITVKKGARTIVNNKKSAKLPAGSYRLTTIVTHKEKSTNKTKVIKKSQRLKVTHLSTRLSNIEIAKPLVSSKGWGKTQLKCLIKLWDRESRWNHKAKNRFSGAYGIPQAYPGNKLSTAGRDWRTNPKTQIKWGLKYIDGRYGNPCKAKAHSDRRGWY